MIKAVIFDIDGVLVDSSKANLKFYREVLKAAGYPKLSVENYRQGAWMTMQDNLKRLTNPQDPREVRRVWRLANKIAIPVHLYKKPKGLIKVIKDLSKEYKLGVVTSRTRRAARAALDYLEIRRYFDTVVAFQDSKNPKPHPEPLLKALKRLKIKAKQAVYIGDSPTDILAAKAAGIKSVGFGKKPLKGADVNVRHFIKIPGFIKTL